jgi:hypothetical protein
MTTSPGNDVDARVELVLARARRFADDDLEGIEEAAKDLARLAGGDVAVVAGARQRAVRAVADDPGRHSKQVLSLIRRAMEVGDWDWGAYEAPPG